MPAELIEYLAVQLEIEDPACVKAYEEAPWFWMLDAGHPEGNENRPAVTRPVLVFTGFRTDPWVTGRLAAGPRFRAPSPLRRAR